MLSKHTLIILLYVYKDQNCTYNCFIECKKKLSLFVYFLSIFLTNFFITFAFFNIQYIRIFKTEEELTNQHI